MKPGLIERRPLIIGCGIAFLVVIVGLVVASTLIARSCDVDLDISACSIARSTTQTSPPVSVVQAPVVPAGAAGLLQVAAVTAPDRVKLAIDRYARFVDQRGNGDVTRSQALADALVIEQYVSSCQDPA